MTNSSQEITDISSKHNHHWSLTAITYSSPNNTEKIRVESDCFTLLSTPASESDSSIHKLDMPSSNLLSSKWYIQKQDQHELNIKEMCAVLCCSVVFKSLWPPWTVAHQTDSSVHGDSPGKNKGVGYHSLLQGIFPTQGLNPGLPHCRWILYHPSHQETYLGRYFRVPGHLLTHSSAAEE